jgi:hypothetical protein
VLYLIGQTTIEELKDRLCSFEWTASDISHGRIHILADSEFWLVRVEGWGDKKISEDPIFRKPKMNFSKTDFWKK